MQAPDTKAGSCHTGNGLRGGSDTGTLGVGKDRKRVQKVQGASHHKK